MKRIPTIFALLLLIVTQLNAEDMKINVTIGNRTFVGTIVDTETGKAFCDMLPLTLSMSELNGNEKYCYLDTSLPAVAYRPGTINAGDLMLYGSSCVVLFYETFSSGYAYTRIGALDDVAGLAEALGNGGVDVKFEKVSSAVTAIHDAHSDDVVVAICDMKGNVLPTSDVGRLSQGVYIVKYGNGEIKKMLKQ